MVKLYDDPMEEITEYYADEIRRLEAKASEKSKAMWIDVLVKQPEENRLLLYFFSGCGGAFLGYYHGRDDEYPCENDHIFGGDGGFLTGDATHWMYVPEDPV